jgi:hypothetical protein
MKVILQIESTEKFADSLQAEGITRRPDPGQPFVVDAIVQVAECVSVPITLTGERVAGSTGGGHVVALGSKVDWAGGLRVGTDPQEEARNVD